jgi:hypothetical protein
MNVHCPPLAGEVVQRKEFSNGVDKEDINDEIIIIILVFK